MKQLSYLVLSLFFLGFMGCSSDDNNSSGNGGNQDDELYIRFTVNGQSYDFEPATVGSLQKHIMGVDDFNDVNPVFHYGCL